MNPQSERTTWQYDSLGRPTTMTLGNGAIAEYDYDGGGRTTAVRNLKSDRTVISIFTYSYDSAGNRTGVQEASGDRVTWSYDSSYQLTREQRSGTNAYDVTYTYDAVGNRSVKLEAGVRTTYSYDNANQLSVEYTPSARTTYTYDANGNTSAINAAGSRTTYTWDLENHITAVQLPVGSRNTYTYDGQGKRRQRQDSEGTRNLVWDFQNIVSELDGSNNTVADYTLAPQAFGNLISQRRSGATSFHHFDALGSTDRLTNSAQSALVSYLYRAFGEQSVLSGSATNPFTWVGRLGYYRQPDTSDFWVRARVYRPTAGRWVSRDPMFTSLQRRTKGCYRPEAARPVTPYPGAEEWNPYLYAQNSPIALTDPSGLWVHVLAGAIAGCLAGYLLSWATGGSKCERRWSCVFSAIVGAAVAALATIDPLILGCASGAASTLASELASAKCGHPINPWCLVLNAIVSIALSCLVGYGVKYSESEIDELLKRLLIALLGNSYAYSVHRMCRW